jgi:hypothetical protein
MPDKIVSRPQVETELARGAPGRTMARLEPAYLLFCLALILGGLFVGLVVSLAT